MKSILEPMVIKENLYEQLFDDLSIENIKTYMINYDSTLTYMSEGSINDYKCLEEFLVRHQKAEMMRIYTWSSKKEIFEKIELTNKFHRDIKYISTVNRRKEKLYREKYFPLTLKEVNRDFFELEYRFVGEVKEIQKEDAIFDISHDLGVLNIKTLDIDLTRLSKVYSFENESYIFILEDKIYKIYSEGGTGYGEGLVCYRDTNLDTFGNKRFNFYHEEFKDFLPQLDDDKYINYLNHFLFDQNKRNIVVCNEKETEYIGIKNVLKQFHLYNSNLADKIYQSIFENSLIQNEAINNLKSTSFKVHYMQEVFSKYTVSYNYAVILIGEFVYIVFWDNY